MKTLITTILIAILPGIIFSQNPDCNTILTQGKSSIKQTPEDITFSVELEVRDMDYVKCADLAIQKIDTFKILFEENGLDPSLIKTTSYRIDEMIEIENRTQQRILRGYRASIPIQIRGKVNDSSTSKIFELLTSSTKSRLRINFELSSIQMEEIKEELLSLAIEDATTKANILAGNLKIKLGKVKMVQYGDPKLIRNFNQLNNELRTERLMSASSVSRSNISSLSPPDINMVADVVIAWEIL
jgi:uncharacterized protein YggE